MDFYLDSKVRNCWRNDIFLNITNGKSILTTSKLEDWKIYKILNQCLLSSVSSSLAKWLLLLDLKEVGELIISNIAIDTLRYQVMDENEYINPNIDLLF